MPLLLNTVYNLNCMELLKQLDDESVDLFLLDPPYHMGNKPFINRVKKYKRMIAEWDNQWVSDHNYDMWCKDWIEACYLKSKKGGSIVITGTFHSVFGVRNLLETSAYVFRNFITWFKPNCLAGSTRLYARTQNGIIQSTLKDLVRLHPSTVKLWDGEKWNQVVSWTLNYRPRDILTIYFRNGEHITCTGEHRFPTGSGLTPARELSVGDIVDSSTLPEGESHPAQLPDSLGWFIGMYLAEGSMGGGNCIQISSHIDEVESRFLRLGKLAKAYGGTCRWYALEGKSATVNIHSGILKSILHLYLAGDSAKTKRLTNRVWNRRNRFLYQLLRGYLDGDGHHDVKNKRWRLGFTRNYSLANDLRILAARLNVDLQLSAHIYNGNKVYNGTLKFRNITKSKYEIIQIKNRKSSKARFWDVSLEQEPHVFALASGLLTHNSMPVFMAKKMGAYAYSCEYINYFSKGKVAYFGYDYLKELNNGKQHRDIFIINNRPHSESVGHPTQKPLALWKPLVQAHCPPDGLVVDFFAGSGTTGVVAKETGRNYILGEASEAYCEMIERRLS